jgi:RNA polymerase primary sigma factor
LELPRQQVENLLAVPVASISLDQPVGDNGAEVGGFIPDERADQAFEEVESDLHAEALLRLVADLSDRERKVLESRLGVGGKKQLTLEEIGKQLGVTRERVRQLETQALARLSRQLLNGGSAGRPDEAQLRR